jgi:hypothetical protein
MTVMAVAVRLADLQSMHPLLLWEPIITTTVAVLSQGSRRSPFRFRLAVEGVHGFGTDVLELEIDPEGVRPLDVQRVRRTLEPSRQVELAAIAVAALGLHLAGEHEIVDLAARGRGADYLVGAELRPLEIAGRSRRRDLERTWEQKRQRLAERRERGVYICVCEFATRTGRLAFLE